MHSVSQPLELSGAPQPNLVEKFSLRDNPETNVTFVNLPPMNACTGPAGNELPKSI